MSTDNKSSEPSTLVYRHSQSFSKLIKGVKHSIKEDLMDGKKGLSFHYLNKVGDSKFFSITVKQTAEDNFSVRSKTDDNQTDTDVNMVGLMKIIKENKDLAFVNKYITDDQGKYGARRAKAGVRKSKKSKKSRSKKVSTTKKRRKSRKSQKGGTVADKTLVGGAKKRRARKSKSKTSRKSRSKKGSTTKKRRKSRKSQKGGNVGTGTLVGGAKKRRARKSKSKTSRKSRSKKGSTTKKRRKSRKSQKGGHKSGDVTIKNNNVDPDMIILN
uniref:Uncharacterized protein n=1 Tax=viral metagenome TaxID=1070528 RepID=A0A6C0J693_9ZZZZ